MNYRTDYATHLKGALKQAIQDVVRIRSEFKSSCQMAKDLNRPVPKECAALQEAMQRYYHFFSQVNDPKEIPDWFEVFEDLPFESQVEYFKANIPNSMDKKVLRGKIGFWVFANCCIKADFSAQGTVQDLLVMRNSEGRINYDRLHNIGYDVIREYVPEIEFKL